MKFTGFNSTARNSQLQASLQIAFLELNVVMKLEKFTELDSNQFHVLMKTLQHHYSARTSAISDSTAKEFNGSKSMDS